LPAIRLPAIFFDNLPTQLSDFQPRYYDTFQSNFRQFLAGLIFRAFLKDRNEVLMIVTPSDQDQMDADRNIPVDRFAVSDKKVILSYN
jgi:hypothetical protein